LCELLLVTMSEPESPPALKVLLLMTTWLVKETVNFLPPPQPLWYCTLTLVLTELMLPVVNPVVRPLLATPMPTAGGTVVPLGTPMSSMKPVGSIVPGRSWAMAASTFEGPSGAATVKSATTVVTWQLASIMPGCETSSPATAAPLRPRTWLLLRMYCVPVLSMSSAPSVPLQQKDLERSRTLPPETPRCRFLTRWLGPLSARLEVV
jgi:hypothetical protein